MANGRVDSAGEAIFGGLGKGLTALVPLMIQAQQQQMARIELQFKIDANKLTNLKTAEFGWPIGMPVCKPIGQGIFEIRSDLTQGRIARVLFCIIDSHMVLLHAFIKKTQKTPPYELDVAIKRKKELMK